MRLQPEFRTKKREDGGVPFVMLAHLHRDGRLKEKNAFMGLVALLSTTQDVSAAWLAREIGVHPDTAADTLKVLIKAGYLIRATIRKGQRNDCQYLVLGQALQRDEDQQLDLEDPWTAAAVAKAHETWPKVVRFDPPLPEVSGGSSHPADLTRLMSPGSPHPAETTPAREEVSGPGSVEVSDQGRSVADAPSPRARGRAAAASARKPREVSARVGGSWATYDESTDAVVACYRRGLGTNERKVRDVPKAVGLLMELTENQGRIGAEEWLSFFFADSTHPWSTDALDTFIRRDSPTQRQARRRSLAELGDLVHSK